MKPQAQDRTKARWAVGLFAVAILVAFYDLLPSQRAAPPLPEIRGSVAKVVSSKDIREFPLRTDLFEHRQFVSFESGRNIFKMQEEKHNSSPGTETSGVVPPGSDQPKLNIETVAPIDLKFFGYFRRSGEPKKILVSQGDVVFVAQEGSLVGLRYKILEIKSNSIVVQDVLSNQWQSLGLMQ